MERVGERGGAEARWCCSDKMVDDIKTLIMDDSVLVNIDVLKG